MPIPIPPHLLLSIPRVGASAYYGGSTLLATVLAHNLYKSTPEWVRNDESWKALGGIQNDDDNNDVGFVDEMASLTAVISKLEGLVIDGFEKLGSQRRMGRRRHIVNSVSKCNLNGSVGGVSESSVSKDCGGEEAFNNNTTTLPHEGENNINQNHQKQEETVISPLEWHAALLAYWQLCNQIRERHPEWRDDVYHQSVKKVDDNVEDSSEVMEDNVITPCQIKELQTMLSHAIWAYEPKEESLRTYLSSCGVSSDNNEEGEEKNDDDFVKINNDGGYQLIVHRTTSYIDPNEKVIPDNNTDDNNSNNIKVKKKKKKEKKQRKPPGRVGYFVAISHNTQTVLISIKGTSTLEEILTDCCGRAVREDLDNDPHHYHSKSSSANNDASDNGVSEVDEIVSDLLISSDHHHHSESEIDKSSSDAAADGYNEENDILHNNNEDEECSSSDEDLVHLVHVSASNDDSVEVELANDNNDVLLDSSSRSNTGAMNTFKKNEDTTTTCGTSKSLSSSSGKVASSENVLLFQSSHSRSKKSYQTRSSTTSNNAKEPPEIVHSPTDEYMETHGVEMEENRSHKLRGVHEGILHCAQQLIFEISPLIEEYAVSKGYNVVCCGHSLGAGTAVLLAVLIRGKYPSLTVPTSALSSKSPASMSDEKVERVRAVAFAPPPVLDRASSLACSHYVTSIVFNSDIIPRSSLTNLDTFLTILEAIRAQLEVVGMNPGSKQPKSNAISSTISLFRKLCEGTNGNLLLHPTELQRLWEEAVSEASLGDGETDSFYWDEEFGHHLFVPGKLLLMFENWSSEAGVEDVPLSSDEEGKDIKGTKQLFSQQNGKAFHAMWTDGTISVLRRLDIGAGSSLATDHLTTSYERALTLLEQKTCV